MTKRIKTTVEGNQIAHDCTLSDVWSVGREPCICNCVTNTMSVSSLLIRRPPMRLLRIVLLSLLAVGVAVAKPAIAWDEEGAVQLKQIGNPIWKPVDFHVFTVAIGTPDDNFAEFQQNQIALLPPPNHQWCTDLGIGPGAPHQPPYNHEIDSNLDRTDFRESLVFRVPEFSPPNAVWAVWMTVPQPGTVGSSPDFSSGPIIPNTLFPIHVTGQTFRNNQLWDPFLGNFDVPPLTDKLSCPFSVDGHSHFPIFFADNSSFGPGGPPTGHYEYRITMTDTAGNGWSITVRFTVRPGE